MRLSALVLTVAAFVGVAAGSPSPGAAADGRRVVAEARFAVTDAPDQAELVQLVVNFPPEASTSLHTHGGQAINLVLEGEITLRQNGVDRPHRAGQA
jgi:quercetin dioxygenase-like cupin family protein